MSSFQTIQIYHLHKSGTSSRELAVTTEKKLNICVNNHIFDSIMRTPGDEKAHIMGLLFSHQLISRADELQSFKITWAKNEDTAQVYFQKTHKNDFFKRANIKHSLTDILHCIDLLSRYQPLRAKTRATHAALLLDHQCNPITAKEDAGRHNALDKVIGQALLDCSLDRAHILVLSSRVSHELMIKILKTPIQCVFSVSRPTSLAVQLGREFGMTMACLSKNDGVLVFSGYNNLFTS